MSVHQLIAQHNMSGTYPNTWDDFIGQDKAKRHLQVAVESSKKREASLDHVLLASGVAGLGKTAMALLTVNDLDVEMKMVSGSIGTNEARIALSELYDGDVLFIDECHALVRGGKGKAEWLLHLLTDGVIMGPRGPEVQPDITVIGATTDAGRLPETIISRFPLSPTLEPYTDEEATKIAITMAEQILPCDLPFPQLEDFQAVARAGSNNPRVIGSILRSVRDLAVVDLDVVCDGEFYDLSEPLSWLGLTPDGLSDVAQRYLIILLKEFQGQSGGKALQDRLQEPGGLEYVERLLMERDYVVKTSQGRILTKSGIERAKELADE